MLIRPASSADVEVLRALRNHFVEHSLSTFGEEPLSVAEVEAWLSGFSLTGKYRLLVAEESGRLLGFASSQQYRAHRAFAQTVETSIYLAPDCSGRGVGSALYEALFASIASEGLHRAVVGVALPNEASVRLHKKFGFAEVGVFSEYAMKRGQFISSVWLERVL